MSIDKVVNSFLDLLFVLRDKLREINLMYIFNKKKTKQNKSELNIPEFVQSRVHYDLYNIFDKSVAIYNVLTFAKRFSHEHLSFI